MKEIKNVFSVTCYIPFTPKLLLLLFILFNAPLAHAGICNASRDLEPDDDSKVEERHHRDVFTKRAYFGNRAYNQLLIQCNRKRDSNGKEVQKVFSDADDPGFYSLLKESDLDWKVIRGKYKFYGKVPFSYVYLLSKKNNVWQLVIPYKAKIRDLSPGRVDLFRGNRPVTDAEKGVIGPSDKSGPAWLFYENDQVTNETAAGLSQTVVKSNAKSIAHTLCSDTTYTKGKDKYDGQSGFNSHKRDRENKHITLGRIQYRYKSLDPNNVKEGCRVDKNKALYYADPLLGQNANGKAIVRKVLPGDWVLENFVAVAEEYWSRSPDFRLRLWLKGFNDDDIHQNIQRRFEPDDHLTLNFATKFMRGNNQMYKSNAYQYNNFSTMTNDGTYMHEVGHAMGLDDEYGASANILGLVEIGEDSACDNGHFNSLGTPLPETYMMCDGYADSEVTTVYQYLAVSRYGTKQRECKQDSQCNVGEWCDAGLDLKRNTCRVLLADGANCPAINGGRTCESGHCRFGQCYTPNSVPMGGQCFTQDQCQLGKCNNAIDGTPGTCVCKQDKDCGDNRYCDGGLDLQQNQCRSLSANNAACPAINGGRTCQSGLCQWGRCFEPKSVNIGGTCYVNDACKNGKCSSINGTKGQCVCDSDNDCGNNSVCKKGILGIGINQCVGEEKSSCPSGWKHDVRNPLNKDQCLRTTTISAPLKCKLLLTDNAKNWTGPHAKKGTDECRSTKGKSPKGVKCPKGYDYIKKSGADSCTKESTEKKTPTCPIGFNYKSVVGWDMCEEKT